MKFYLNNREVEVLIEHNRKGGCEDSYIVSGGYVDTNVDLTDSELDLLNDLYRSEIEEDYMNYIIGEADFYEVD